MMDIKQKFAKIKDFVKQKFAKIKDFVKQKFAKIRHTALLTVGIVTTSATTACGSFGTTTTVLQQQKTYVGEDGRTYTVVETKGIENNYKQVIALEESRTNNTVNVINAVGGQINEFHETTMRFGMPMLAAFFGSFFQFKSNETYYKTAKSMNQTNVDANVKMFNTAVKAAKPAPRPHNNGGNGGSGRGGITEDDFVDAWRNNRTGYTNGNSHCIPEGTNGVHNSYNSVKDKLDNMYKTPFSVMQKRVINGHELVEQNTRC